MCKTHLVEKFSIFTQGTVRQVVAVRARPPHSARLDGPWIFFRIIGRPVELAAIRADDDGHRVRVQASLVRAFQRRKNCEKGEWVAQEVDKDMDQSQVWPDWAVFKSYLFTINFLTRVAQIFLDFWGYFEKCNFFSTFSNFLLGNFWKIMATFLLMFGHTGSDAVVNYTRPSSNWIVVLSRWSTL